MADDYGGLREKRARVVMFGKDGTLPEARNVASAYAADGYVLFQWAWRPFYVQQSHVSRELFEKHHGLFICG
jgi:hypothetical protein